MGGGGAGFFSARAAHSYAVNGQPYPSVSHILGKMGLRGDQKWPAWAAARGSAVHEAIKTVESGIIKPDAYAETEIAPRLSAWLKAKQDLRLEGPWTIEQPTVDTLLGYSGTPDCQCMRAGAPCLIDWKNGSLEPWHGLQLAAYAMFSGIRARFILELRADGSYRLHDRWQDELFSARSWDKYWMEAVSLWHWQDRHVGKEKKAC